jgi:alpha-tubulin suppressor-like RCC1 family protein
MSVILSTSNIIIDYRTSNFTMETVKTSPFTQKDTVGTISNLLAEPFVDTVSRMYPPSRSFISNNFTLSGGFITSVACGNNITMLVTNTGRVYSCGRNNRGQLGLGDYTHRTTPVLINTTTSEDTPKAFDTLTITSVACGNLHTLFRTSTGLVYASGFNEFGELGFDSLSFGQSAPRLITTTTSGGTPTAFNNLSISAISCGGWFSLFLTSTGRVYSCGINQEGQLGFSTNFGTSNRNPTPTLITTTTSGGTPTAFNNLTISAIEGGWTHSLFITGGKVYACGRNVEGQLGLGNLTTISTPTLITTTTSGGTPTAFNNLTITSIAAGYLFSTFLTSAGKVYSCGTNDYGALGYLTGSHGAASIKPTPTLITTMTSGVGVTPTAFNNLTIIAMAAGYLGKPLYLTSDNQVYQLGGNPYETEMFMMTSIDSTTTFSITAIASGNQHKVIVNNDGNVYSFGYNDYGELGLGNLSTPFSPTKMPSFLPTIPYGSGTYTVSYSSFTASSEPFRCFNNTSSVNNAATWAANNYTSGTGIYNKTLNLVSGYNGDWVRIQLPVSIKLRSFAIKQISTDLNRAPKNFRFYGSTNGTSWVLLVDKTNTVYTNLFYAHTDMTQYASNTSQFYNHFGIVVNTLLGTSETTLSFDELYIYGSEQVTFTRSVVDSTNKLLSFTLLYGLSNYPNSDLGYNITFPTPTFVNSISTSTNLILGGEYRLNILNSSSSQLIPNGGQTNIVNVGTLNLPTTNVQVNYHLLNPLKNNSESAQWTYSPIDTSVYHLGNVGIMTKTPSYQLEINNNIYVSGTAFTGSSQTNWVILSDKRIKENIVKASYETCFENVKNIELYRFNFKANTVNNNDFNQLGFIAQEVRNIFPKAVEVNMIQDNNGIIPDLLTLNITQIKYTLYGAVKYLLEKIEKLERNLELKNRAYTGTLDRTLYFQGNNIGTLDFQGNNIKILDNQGNNIGTLDIGTLDFQ